MIDSCTLVPKPLPPTPQGIHVVTPNKKLGSGPLEQYQNVRRMQREGYIHFFYEVCTCVSDGRGGKRVVGCRSLKSGPFANCVA